MRLRRWVQKGRGGSKGETGRYQKLQGGERGEKRAQGHTETGHRESAEDFWNTTICSRDR